MCDDVWKTTGQLVPAVFKQIAVYDTLKLIDAKIDFVFTYSLSDRDSTDGDDTRVLECGVYNENGSNFMMTFKIKLEHVLSARDNFRTYVNEIRKQIAQGSTEGINTYLIPIYLYAEREGDTKPPKYTRFSTFVKDDSLEYIHGLIETMLFSLNRYIFVNTFAWFNLNNNTSYHISTDINAPYITPKKVVNRQNLARIARSNKYLVICLDNPHNICLITNTARKNMYSDASNRLYSLSKYKFQVIGHYQHYWIGKGRKTRIKKWIDPYYKNDDYQFNVVKEYYQKNAPEA
jgi:hypothetical protein